MNAYVNFTGEKLVTDLVPGQLTSLLGPRFSPSKLFQQLSIIKFMFFFFFQPFWCWID